MLIGACGSLNAANLPSYLLAFAAWASEIRVVLTASASRLVQQAAIEAITGNRVFNDTENHGVPAVHATLAEWAERFLVMPATAHAIGQAAHGLGGNLVASTVLCSAPPVYFVPSMSQAMWAQPAVQRNVGILKQDGHRIVVGTMPRPVFEGSSGQVRPSHLGASADEIRDAVLAGAGSP